MLRIISGERRGAKLLTPQGMDTRPLRDRVRESLFSILRPQISGAVVLDAFAGSGAVGLEALSNGADHATFVDAAPAALAAIRANIAKLRYEDRTVVVPGFMPAALRRHGVPGQPFTLLALMPPYDSGLCHAVLADASVMGCCSAEALAVCEIRNGETLDPPPGWTVEDDRLYGVTRLLFLRRHSG